MKFRCERDVLVEALTTASRATSGRERMPVLAGARLEILGDRLHVKATDLDLTIEVEATVAGIADGVTVIPAKLAAEIVRALEPGAVTVEADADEARIASGRSQFAVRVLPAEEFPKLLGPPSEEAVVVAGAELADALKQVVRLRARTRAVRRSPACLLRRSTVGCSSRPPTATAWRCATFLEFASCETTSEC